MKKKVIELYEVCGSCGGTGLYQGMAEKDGCAVICSTCDGTGAIHYKHEYIPFTKRKEQKGVRRVFKTSCGYGHCAEDYQFPNRSDVIKFSEAGCTYEEWKNGVAPKPVKELYCPKLFMHQDLSEHPTLKKFCDKEVGSYIPECYKGSKDKLKKCWEMWEKDEAKRKV